MFPPSFPVPAQSMFKVPLLHIGIALVVNVVTCSKEPAYGIFRAVYRHCVRHYPASTASDFPKQTGCFRRFAPASDIHLSAVGAGIQPLFPDAVMYGAKLVAERRFCSVYAAAGAVDHARRDCYPVELRPKRGGFLAQSVVVCNRCDSGVAGFAVQSAAADPLIRIFHSCLHKLKFGG